ncbi:hypothetical protein [Pedobacter cryoconitis]|uniref:Restriction endonuclease n=1 Tax=Pedobacter cryoconitis TaxID=188932 RepID=A0A327SVE9_9SPHI|nr:hypothetical protein [Pedobacter cryoconitis]RAJ31724.1 hypothetical protein LY11_02224 [Pedobacter cryoconitis]
MVGQLDIALISEFENCFQNNCLVLVGEAYKWLYENGNVTIDWDEETISANIFTFIDESEKAISYNISISDECRLYNKDILQNKKKAKAAPRIDLKLATNWIEGRKRICLYVEAKNLIENNCHKANRKSKIDAVRVRSRYIATGIDNFLSGEYPQNGLMLGYILEGTPDNIIDYINLTLVGSSRQNEQLKKVQIDVPYLENSYVSQHNDGFLLSHYFLNFSGEKQYYN